MKFGIEYYSKICQKIQGSLKSDNNNGTVPADRYTVLILSHSFLLRMRNVSDKCCRANQNKYFMFNNFFLTS